MKPEELKKAEQFSKRAFPAKPKKSSMNLLEFDEETEEVLTEAWKETAGENEIRRVKSERIEIGSK
ncbi:MAG TPA: hypothetical protein VK892_19885 [Pyrinomonadaceae bacterium]|nr:hypothetical protein [Pyrinomonadaceae bacterium]